MALVPLTGVTRIDTGYSRTCSVNRAGAVSCWGLDFDGSLGHGPGIISEILPRPLATLTSAVQTIAVGTFHSCALMTSGALKCWGSNSSGELGNGSWTSMSLPTAVPTLSGGVRQVSAGSRHTCAVLIDGALKCWGDNFSGQLGIGGGVPLQATPVTVTGASSGVSAVSTGARHTCAIATGGRVWCWGYNGNGELGNGSTVDQAIPIVVPGLPTGMKAVSAGSEHTCALTATGGVVCWGNNASGQLGIGSTVLMSTAPAPVSGLTSGVRSVSTGVAHTCAVTEAGSALCWGRNIEGQLGIGNYANQFAPVAVTGLGSNVLDIRASEGNHTCATLADATARCWGENQWGELGVGDQYTGPIPTAGVVVWNDPASAVNDITSGGDFESSTAASDGSGRYLAIQSRADNLPGVSVTANTSDIYLIDTQSPTPQATRVSLNDDDTPITADVIEPTVSADATLIAFVAQDSGITSLLGEDRQVTSKRAKASTWSVVLRNRVTGASERIGRFPAMPGGVGTAPRIAPSGRAIVWTAPCPDPRPTNSSCDIGFPTVWRRSLNTPIGAKAGEVEEVLCVSCREASAAGKGFDFSITANRGAPSISADGNFITYQKIPLVPDTTSPCPMNAQIYLWDYVRNVSERIARPPSASACGTSGALVPRIDWSGRNIVFQTDQRLASPDTNSGADVYVLDTTNDRIKRVSQTPAGANPDGASFAPTISGDGSQVSYVSAARNLDVLEPDTNGFADIHVMSLRTGATRRLSKTRSGSESNASSQRPWLNYNGTRLAFDSAADNLTPMAQTGGILDVFNRANPYTEGKLFGAGFE